MDHVEITFPHDTLVVEDMQGQTIKANSQIFCGHCGELVCRVTEDMVLPFPHDYFVERTKDISFKHETGQRGILHETCNKKLFASQPGWHFINITTLRYSELMAKFQDIRNLPEFDKERRKLMLVFKEALNRAGIPAEVNYNNGLFDVALAVDRSRFGPQSAESSSEIERLKEEVERMNRERKKLPMYSWFDMRLAFVEAKSGNYKNFDEFIKEHGK